MRCSLPAMAVPASFQRRAGAPRSTANGRRVTVLDLLDASLIQPGEPVEFVRPRLGQHHHATILRDGSFEPPDGTVQQSPSLAAMRAADLVSYDGWHPWRVPCLGIPSSTSLVCSSSPPPKVSTLPNPVILCSPSRTSSAAQIQQGKSRCPYVRSEAFVLALSDLPWPPSRILSAGEAALMITATSKPSLRHTGRPLRTGGTLCARTSGYPRSPWSSELSYFRKAPYPARHLMIRQNGNDYATVADAARHFKVTPKTVDKWIERGIIPEPPLLERGLGEVRVYPADYLAEADEALERHRKEHRRRPRKGNTNS